MPVTHPATIPFLRLVDTLQASGRPRPVVHNASYEKNLITKQWCCVCSCGLANIGTEDAVKTWGATHDMDGAP